MTQRDSIVITGANGMVGRAVAALLDKRLRCPISLDRAQCDLAYPEDIDELFARYAPALLINCAAHTKVDLCEDEPEKANQINGHAVGHLARLARQHDTYLVHFSTDFVFDGQSRRPYRPDDPPSPISAYGRSKLLGEQQIQQHAPRRWLIVRTAWVYGRNGVCFPRIIVDRARAGQALKVVNDETGSPTFTQDLAEATINLVDRGATGIVHVTNSGSVSRFDFAQASLEEFKVKGAQLSPITTSQWFEIRPKQARRPAYSVLDCTGYEKIVGKPMRPWRKALADYHRSVVARGGF